MKNMFKLFIIFTHHILRPIWFYGLFGVPYFFINFMKYMFNSDRRNKVNCNKIEFYEERDVADFISFWNSKFRGSYKKDGFKGLLDHYNSKYEFFAIMYDCEDVAIYVGRYFRKMGHKTYLIGLYGNKWNSWHYDIIIELAMDKFILFNQGNCKMGYTKEECIRKLGEHWKTFQDCIWWRCYW